MKTIITSAKGPPLRRILCSFLFGAAAFCVVPTNIQAAGDIVWVTTGNTIAKYNGVGPGTANGTAINTNFITVPPVAYKVRLWASYLGGILVHHDPTLGDILYVASLEGIVDYYTLVYHPWWGINSNRYVIATYNAETGDVINFDFFRYPYLGLFVPRGMALSGGTNPNLCVATEYQATAVSQVGSISKINATTGAGIASWINPIVTHWPTPPPTSGLVQAPYALAVNGNVLYVTNNSQNSNGDFYISTYAADNGGLMNANFIQIPTGGLYGLALSKDNTTLYVSVFSGSAPGVYTYKADTGQLIKGPFVSVNEPWGIAIGSPPPNGQDPTLYVASYQDSAIYEFDAGGGPTGGQLIGSIKVSGAPTNITVEPAD